MPGFLLHVGCQVMCAHGGKAQPTVPSPKVFVSGQAGRAAARAVGRRRLRASTANRRERTVRHGDVADWLAARDVVRTATAPDGRGLVVRAVGDSAPADGDLQTRVTAL